MIKLRPHQTELIQKIHKAFHTNKSVLAQAPVGFGKTVVSAYLGKKMFDNNSTMFFCVHTKDLLNQTCKAFSKFDIPFGIIAAGHTERKSNIQICSIPTLKNRLHKHSAPKMVVIDECHFCGASGWAKMVRHYRDRGSYILGLSASPWRLSGDGLGDHFDVMVNGVPVRWLIDNKFLSEYKIFAPSTPNLSNISIRMGDYVQSEISALMDKPSIVGCAVENYKKYANGKNSIAFCTSVEHSRHTAETFKASGINAVHLDGECDIEYRKEVINDFASGHIKVITNCALFSAGFDLSLQVNKDITVESVILLRPTQSLSLYIQMTGRSLRYKPYPAIILDHANCCMTHGMPDDNHEWSLEGSSRRKKSEQPKVSVRTCPSCFGCMQATKDICPYCGHVFTPQGRKIEHKEGELVEVDPAVMRINRLREQSKAKTFEELVEIGKKRGYKNAYSWARILLQVRRQRGQA